jgi:murein DD-endopeptidase MepM/ murein hydrolase activator NlpD
MKPLSFKFIIPLLLGAPAVVPLVGAVATEGVRRMAAEEALSAALRDDDGQLVPAIPAPPALVAAVDQAEKRPQAAVAEQPTSRPAIIQFGDTLLKLAQRHGLTPSDLLRLNPGLDAARLVAGTQIRVAQAVPGRTRLLLGLAPVGSGGLSWPETPQFPEEGQPGRFDGRSVGAGWVWPAKGVFTSGYGWRWGRMHKGIDVANNVGTPIVAAQSGRITFAGWHDGGYGYLVEITHDDGSMSRYAHNSTLMVREGDLVQRGQQISQMGSTGRSTGPHLHFEIHPAGKGAINPLQMLPPRA